MLPEHLRDIPKLSKPYVTNEIHQMIDSLIRPKATH
jgi:hypothetical protein